MWVYSNAENEWCGAGEGYNCHPEDDMAKGATLKVGENDARIAKNESDRAMESEKG